MKNFLPLKVVLPLLLVLLTTVGIISLGVGPVSIAPMEIFGLLFGAGSPNDVESIIVRDLRLPRLLLAMLVGAALAQSGAVMQGFFQNPMADPYIIGISSGAALGATLAFSLGLDFWFAGINSVSLFAFFGSLTVSFVVYGISTRGKRLPASVLLLSGVAIGALAAALTSFLLITSSSNLEQILYWLMGSLASRRWEHVQMVWPYILICMLILQFFAGDLNLLLLGEENAHNLGVNVERVKRIFLIVAALLAATAVSVSGIIGFVGLVVPHIMRLLVGPDHRGLFPASILGGACLVVAADILARTLIAPAEIPIGIITSVLGCPFFLFLLGRRRDAII